MRTNKVAPEDVDQSLFELFRKLGYDGTSMELLSQATGLKKASLYHRFPKGKVEMAQHVLKNAEQWNIDNILNVLTSKNAAPLTRLKKALNSLDTLYNGGASNCLLRTLSVGPDAEVFREEVIKCFDLVTEGFKAIALELGSSEHEAQEKANLINPLIQGALVLSGATGNTSYFKNCLASIPALLQPSK